MEPIINLPRPGKLIIVLDAQGSTWQFGVKYILAGNRILCEWLGNEPEPLVKEAKDLKISITEGVGVSVAPATLISICSDRREYKFLINGNFEMVQRRAYWRLPDPQISVSYELQEEMHEPVKVIDISGGGIGLIVTHEIGVGDDIKVQVALPTGNTARAVARCVRCSKLEDGRGYHIGINFTEIRETEREKIIKYVFDQQVQYQIE